jgi:hypothetical protein
MTRIKCFMWQASWGNTSYSIILLISRHRLESKHYYNITACLSYAGLKLGKEVFTFYEYLTSPASKLLNQRFESDVLKATLSTDAVVGTMTSPMLPGSGYDSCFLWTFFLKKLSDAYLWTATIMNYIKFNYFQQQDELLISCSFAKSWGSVFPL